MSTELIAQIIIIIAKLAIVIGVFMTILTWISFIERRVVAVIQERIGPNRTGPFGLLQPLADGLKLFMKEDLIPDNAEPVTFTLAPMIVIFVSFLGVTVLPFGGTFELFGYEIKLVLLDVNIALLIPLALSSLAVYGIMIGGWSSNNKYSLLGGLRSSAQMISYELALGLSLIPVIMWSGSLNLSEIVELQGGPLWGIKQLGFINNWLVFNPLFWIPFLTFVCSGYAETNRLPFDLPEAETELTGGFHTEYSSMKFAIFFMAEYTAMIVMSGLIVTFFLGGWYAPISILDFSSIPVIGVLAGPFWFLAKLCFFLFLYIWVRGTYPRLRYDQLMAFGWKFLLPVTLGMVVIIAIALVWFDWAT